MHSPHKNGYNSGCAAVILIILGMQSSAAAAVHNYACVKLVAYSGLVGLGLLFPKYYLIFHSEFPKLLLYYSLRVDPLFHKILLKVSQKRPKQTRQEYTCYTQKPIKDLNLPSVDPVAESVDTGTQRQSPSQQS